MSPGRRGFVRESAWCLIGSAMCAGALVAQEAPRRAAAPTARPQQKTSKGGETAPVYGPPKRPPQQVAADPRSDGGGKLKQFAPQPRHPPQASWGQLTPEEDSALELVLQAWEKRSAAVKTLECTFQMWTYTKTKIVKDADRRKSDQPSRICRGVIRYAAPDKGHFHVTEEASDPSAEQPQFVKKEGEHWVCDGNAVYEFNQQQKKLIERRLPEDLKGKAISNSPLPFVFGTTAMQMRQRYWMRLKTPREAVGKEVWLEVEPMFAEDRANYQSALVILEEKKMLPKALSLQLQPAPDCRNYVFDSPSINNPIKKLLGSFAVPDTPRGWKREIEEPPTPDNRPAPPADIQTLRMPQSTKRK